MKTKFLLTMCLLAFVFGLTREPSNADDTDVYINTQTPTGAEPLVMFSFDWRPNLGSTKCQGTVTVGGVTENECQFLVDEGYMDDDDGIATGSEHTFFEVIEASLEKVLSEIDGVKVGIMLNHDDGSGPSCSGPGHGASNTCTNGGYILQGFTDVDDTAEFAKLIGKLNAIPPVQGNQSHIFQGKELFLEFFQYLTGQGIVNGHNGWSDFGTNGTRNINEPEDLPPTGVAEQSWDASVETDPDGEANYKSPLVGRTQCTAIFTMNFMFQTSAQEDDSDAAIENGMTGINLSGSNNNFATVIEYLNDIDLADGTIGTAPEIPGKQNVTSYFFVDPTKVNTTTNGYAQAGGTTAAIPLSDDPREFIDSVKSRFDEILSISTTFAAASVPVNVFNRAQTLNEVFIALFQADDGGRPRWTGNLKKLKIRKLDPSDPNSTSILVDANDQNAISATDGRIKNDALTHWTIPGDLLPAVAPEVDGKDGRAVARGAAGGTVPGFRPTVGNTPGITNQAGATSATTHRKLFTEPDSYINGTPTALRDFDADSATATQLLMDDDTLFETVMECTGCTYVTASTTDRTEAVARTIVLMKFARGIDTEDEDGDSDITEVRPWIIGDTLHSRPRPLNYGVRPGFTETNPDVRVFMATNDGWFRMFRTNDNDGVEAWAFMPRQAIPKVKRLKDNVAGTPVHPYLLDAATSILVIDNDGDGTIEPSSPDNDRVIAFVGLRRAGKAYYALDVSDPDNPEMLWSIDKSHSNFVELGQSWSDPRVGKMLVDLGAGPTNVFTLLFAGGYNGDDDGDKLGDLGKDERDESNPFVGSDDDEGNAFFVVNALTGELIWKAVRASGVQTTGPVLGQDELYRHTGLKDSIPSSVSALDTDGDGNIDRFYAGDTGGVMWRGDVVSSDRGNWTLTPLFSVGRHYYEGIDPTPSAVDTADNANDRRFHHRIDFVQAQDAIGAFDAIIVGSGDRPHPLGKDVANYIYVFKDRAANSGLKTHDDFADLTNNCLEDFDAADSSTIADCVEPTNVLSQLDVGWKVKLETCIDAAPGKCGEKSLARPLTLLGTIFMTTFIPNSTSPSTTCEPAEGSGLIYALSLQDATGGFNFDTSNDDNGETSERSEKLASPGIPSQLVPLGGGDILRGDLDILHVPGASGAKTFWYERELR